MYIQQDNGMRLQLLHSQERHATFSRKLSNLQSIFLLWMLNRRLYFPEALLLIPQQYLIR